MYAIFSGFTIARSPHTWVCVRKKTLFRDKGSCREQGEMLNGFYYILYQFDWLGVEHVCVYLFWSVGSFHKIWGEPYSDFLDVRI